MLDKKIIKLADALEVTTENICEALDVQSVVIPASSFEQAKQNYLEADNNKLPRQAAFKEWLDFCITPAQAKKAYHSLLTDDASIDLALTHWEKVVENEIAKLETPEQAHYLSNNCPDSEIYEGKVSEIMNTVMAKWNQLCLEILPKFKTEDELHEAYDTFPENSSARRKVLIKWMKIDKTAVHFSLVQEYVDSGEDEQLVLYTWGAHALHLVKKASTITEIQLALEESPGNCKASVLALQKLEIAFLPIIETIKTVVDAELAFIDAAIAPNARDVIFEKWLNLSGNFSEALRARQSAQTNKHKSLATKRLLSFCQNIDDVKVAMQYMYIDGNVVIEALQLWLGFCQTISEVKHLYINVDSRNHFQSQVRNKWERLVLAELVSATTPEKAQEVYNQAFGRGVAESETLIKWNQLSLEAIEKTDSFDELKALYRVVPIGKNCQAEKAIIKKMYTLMPND